MKFPQYLQDLIESEQHTLIELSKSTGVDKSDLSKVIRGKKLCGARTLGLLLASFTQNQQQMALRYWLLDQIPQEYLHLVSVQNDLECVVKDEGPNIRTLEGALEGLRSHAAENQHLRVVLMSLAKAFGL